MSQVDEALIHAFLDGELSPAEVTRVEQLVSESADWRSAMEHARSVRTRARDILAQAGPTDVPIPPFEQIQARAEVRRRKGPTFTLGRLRTLAWAATVVLAVGIGWAARDALVEREAPAGIQERFDEARTEALASDTTGQAAPPTEADTPGRRVQFSAETLSENRPTATRAEEEGEPAAVRPVAADEMKQAQLVSPAAADEGALLRRGRIAAVEAAESPRPRDAADALGKAVREETLSFGSGTPYGGLAWQPVERATAEEIWGAPIRGVEGLPILAFATASGASGPVVAVRHQLDLALLDLFWERPSLADLDERRQAEAAPSAQASGAIPASSTYTENRSGLRLTLVAPVPADSLRSLARRVPVP